MAALHFDITADDTQFVTTVQSLQQRVKQASATIEQVGKNFDISSLDEQVISLTKVIRDNEESIQRATNTLAKYSVDAKQALDVGDTATFNVINADIEEQITKLQQLEAETQGYRETLATIQQMQGGGGGGVLAPMLFGSQEDYDNVLRMREGIAEMQNQIAQFDGSDEELNALRSQLSEQQAVLNGVELAAAKAASAYGGDLGSRAAQASSQLYDLNNAVKQQERAVKEAKDASEQAAQALKDLSASADPSEIERAQIAYDNAAQSLQNEQMALVNLQAAQQNAQSSWNAVNGEMERHDSILVKMLGGQEKFNAAVQAMPAPLQSAVLGLQGMTGAAKAFIATPLGAVIAALVLAWQALTTWFNSSKEGQLAFAKVSGYTTGILNQLKEVAIRVGKFLYTMFTDPQKAIKQFWEAVKKNVVNRFKALGEMAQEVGTILKHAFTLKFDLIRDDLSRLMNSFLKFGTGVENVMDKVRDSIASIHEKASENAAISVEKKELEMQVSEWQKTNAELDKEKAKAQRKMYDTSLSAAERKKAADDYQKILKQQTDAEKKFADKRIELQQRGMALTTNTIEDYQELNRLEAESVQIEARHEQQLASLQRRLNMINRASAGSNNGKTGAKTNEIGAAVDKLVSMQEQFEFAVKEGEAALTGDSVEQRIKQINLNYEKGIAELERKRKEYEATAKKAGIDKNDKDYKETMELIERMQKQLAQVRDKQLDEIQREDTKAMLQFLKDYGTYQEQRLAIAEEYAQKIAKATSEGERLSLQAEQRAVEQRLDMDAWRDSIDWDKIFNDLDSVSERHLETLRKRLAFVLNDGTIAAEDYAAIVERIDKVDAQITARQNEWRNAIGLTIPAIEKQKQLMQEAAEAAERVNDLQGQRDTAQQTVNALQKALQDYIVGTGIVINPNDITVKNADSILANFDKDSEVYKELQSKFGELAEGEQNLTKITINYGKAQQDASIKADKAANTLTKALTVISQITQKVNANIESAVELIDTLGLSDSAFGKGFGHFAEAADSMSNALSNIQSGNFIGAANGVLSAVSSLGQALGALGLGGFGDSDKSLIRDLERLTAANESLEHAVEELTDEMQNGAVAEASEVYKQILEDIERSIDNTQQMMARSGAAYNNGFLGVGGKGSSNKRIDAGMTASDWAQVSRITGASVNNAADFWRLTSKQMSDVAKRAPEIYARIKDLADDGYKDAAQFMDTYIEYWKQLEEAESAYFEKMTNTTFDTIVDDFKSALLDMDSSAADFAENFEKYMQNAIISALISDQYEPLLKDWYGEFAKSMEDGLTDNEIAELKRQWNDITTQGLQDREQLRQLFGWGSTGEREGAFGAVKSFSQEQGDELNGRLTAIQIGQEQIRRDVSAGVDMLRVIAIGGGYLDQMRGIALSNNQFLEQISRNTVVITKFGETLDRIATNTEAL